MIRRSTAAIIAIIAFAAGMGIGILAWNAITAGSGEASMSASDAAATLAARPTNTSAATTAPTTVPATKAATAEATTEAAAVTEAATEAVAAASQPITYSIDATKSQVSFTMQEDLRGQRVDVIGTTQDVGGDILIDLANPQNSQVKPIVINARTLKTDQDFRNQAIRSRILRSAEDAYEFITFTPTAITGLPSTAVTSGPITFQVTGDLKIVEVTKSVTFDVTVNSISDTSISGTGSAVITWADFNLSIPAAPGVANVTPEATLKIDFVANAAGAAAAPAATSEAAAATEVVATEAAAAVTDAAPAATEAAATAKTVTYSIDATKSQVSFTMQEDLRGSRVDVIGTTQDVGGDLLIDLANPQNSQVKPIVINARTLKTDQDMRNNAIRSRILRSAEDAYEFITFTPTAITGLPSTAVTSGPITFQVTGDLKIVEVTKSVTFDVTVNSISDTSISGTGSAVITWADFNLSIPSVPFVANVTPEATLKIDFVANAK